MIVESRYNRFQLNTSCLIVSEIAFALPNFHIDITRLNLPNRIQLADSIFHVPAKIDILIGTGHFWDIVQNNQIMCGHKLPKLQNTNYG